MTEAVRNEYEPDTVSHPGETLDDEIAELGMSQAELAERMGRPRQAVNELIRGKKAFTPDTALELERVLGVPASFWTARQRAYDAAVARRAEEARLSREVSWLREFPYAELVKRKWLPKRQKTTDRVRDALGYFGYASPAQWRAQTATVGVGFRRSVRFKSDPGAARAWLRRAELLARDVRCAPFNLTRFRKAVHSARRLTVKDVEEVLPQLQALFAETGVAVVLVDALAKSRVSGAAFWLGPERGVIALRLRRGSEDRLWFTFFHEAAHILLHGRGAPFIDEDRAANTTQENEANDFAASTLLPPGALEDLHRSGQVTEASIRRFAQEHGVVVGQPEHTKAISPSPARTT